MGRNRINDNKISGVFELKGENMEAFLDYKNSINKTSQANNKRVFDKIITAWRTAIPSALRGGQKP